MYVIRRLKVKAKISTHKRGQDKRRYFRQVKQLFQDLEFKNKLKAADRRACVAFENVSSRFLGK